MHRAVFVTLALSLFTLPPAIAEEAQSKTVSLAGVDISTRAGADQALRRIRHAALDVCDVRTGAQPIAELRRQQDCVREAVSRSVAMLGNANVTARYVRERDAVFASR